MLFVLLLVFVSVNLLLLLVLYGHHSCPLALSLIFACDFPGLWFRVCPAVILPVPMHRSLLHVLLYCELHGVFGLRVVCFNDD